MSWSEKYKKSINCDNPKGFSQRAHCQGRKKDMKEAMEKQDHEISMAKKQVSKSINNLQKLAKILSKKTDKENLPAWVQAKLSDTEHNTDAAASYMEEEKKKCGDGKYWCKTDRKCKLIPAGYHTMPNGNLMKDDEHGENGDVSESKRDGKSARDPNYSLKDWFNDEWVQTGGKYDGKPCAKQPGQTTKPFCRDPDDRAAMTKDERERRAKKKRREDPNPNKIGKAKIVSASYEPKGEQIDELWGKVALAAGAATIPYFMKKFAKPSVDKAIDAPATESGTLIDRLKQKRDATNKALQKNSYELQGETIEEKKDACYHKVKSRYKIWPSAYASGALVRCRKVGAANWGNRSESYEFSNWRDEFFPTEVETANIIEPEPLRPSKGIGSQLIDEAGKKCWPGYKKKGTQKLFGKIYNRCVKEGYSNWREELGLTEDWQKVNRQDKTDGLSPAAVKAYRRENPGSKLQTAVTEKKPTGKRAKRRASFCRRMKGMKSKLTSAKTARDPDSRINKALRRWNCN